MQDRSESGKGLSHPHIVCEEGNRGSVRDYTVYQEPYAPNLMGKETAIWNPRNPENSIPDVPVPRL
jgi:hypothetical protein